VCEEMPQKEETNKPLGCHEGGDVARTEAREVRDSWTNMCVCVCVCVRLLEMSVMPLVGPERADIDHRP
jgi:hypothetical protein